MSSGSIVLRLHINTQKNQSPSSTGFVLLNFKDRLHRRVFGRTTYTRRRPIGRQVSKEACMGDSCDDDGAKRLKKKIEDYWRERFGVEPTVNTVEAGFVPAMRSARTDIRSDMVNGMPRRQKSSRTQKSTNGKTELKDKDPPCKSGSIANRKHYEI